MLEVVRVTGGAVLAVFGFVAALATIQEYKRQRLMGRLGFRPGEYVLGPLIIVVAATLLGAAWALRLL